MSSGLLVILIFVKLCKLNSMKLTSFFWDHYSVSKQIPAWEVSVFGVILIHIFPYSDWIRTRITPNTDTFYAVQICRLFLNFKLAFQIFLMHESRFFVILTEFKWDCKLPTKNLCWFLVTEQPFLPMTDKDFFPIFPFSLLVH